MGAFAADRVPAEELAGRLDVLGKFCPAAAQHRGELRIDRPGPAFPPSQHIDQSHVHCPFRRLFLAAVRGADIRDSLINPNRFADRVGTTTVAASKGRVCR